MGHARAILSIDKPALQLKVYNEILKKGLSVRQVEELAKQYRDAPDEAGQKAAVTLKRLGNKDYDILKKHLSSTFRTPVKLTCDASGKGKITFPFKSEDELEKLNAIFDRLKTDDSEAR